MGNIENFVFLPDLLALLFFFFLSFFFNDILLFTLSLGCPSAVVICMLPVTVLCGSWCAGADKPGCHVLGDLAQAVSEIPQ